MTPLVFAPYLRPQIWGNRKLQQLGKALPAEGTFGESWEISAHPHHVSRVAEGPLQGTLLTEICERHRTELFGAAPSIAGHFPLLIKLLDCHDLLSVQVHPTDTLAHQLAGEENGKTEAWVVLDAEPTGRIYAGLLPNTTREVLERHLLDKTVEKCLHCVTPMPGDCVFLPAGTVHAVGGGVLMAEVQQSSDATFRLYDWNRLGSDGKPRKLHIEEALASIDWKSGPVQPLRGNADSAAAREVLVRCKYFQLERFHLREPLPVPYLGRFSIWMVVKGQADLQSPPMEYRRMCRRGDTVLVPASAVGLSWNPVPTRGEGEEFATLLGICSV